MLAAWLSTSRTGAAPQLPLHVEKHIESEAWWRSAALPVVMFAVSAVASRELRELDVGELERLRYDYIGA